MISEKDIERQFLFFGLADPSTKRNGLIIYGADYDLKSIKRVNHENKELVKIINHHEARSKGIGQVKRDGEVVEINLPAKKTWNL